jgi:hypothetical protein
MRAGGVRQLVRIRNIGYSDRTDCMTYIDGRQLSLPLAQFESNSMTAPAGCVWLNMTAGTAAIPCRRQVTYLVSGKLARSVAL